MDIEQCTFTDLLEYSIPGDSFAISPDETTRSRINNGVGTLAVKVCEEYAKPLREERDKTWTPKASYFIFTLEKQSLLQI